MLHSYLSLTKALFWGQIHILPYFYSYPDYLDISLFTGFLECQEMSGSYFFLNSFKKEKINLPSTFDIYYSDFIIIIIFTVI